MIYLTNVTCFDVLLYIPVTYLRGDFVPKQWGYAAMCFVWSNFTLNDVDTAKLKEITQVRVKDAHFSRSRLVKSA